MSYVSTYIRIRCDHPKCPQDILVRALATGESQEMTLCHVTRLLLEIKAMGWQISDADGLHYCERHWKSGGGPLAFEPHLPVGGAERE